MGCENDAAHWQDPSAGPWGRWPMGWTKINTNMKHTKAAQHTNGCMATHASVGVQASSCCCANTEIALVNAN
jgi:hypothetical protein